MRILCIVFWALMGGSAWADCRHALVMGLDISGSVDWKEYRLQLSGVAEALTSDEVSEMVLSDPEAPIELYIFEWSSDIHQRTILNWTTLDSMATLQAVATVLNEHSKDRITLKTALGSALRHSYQKLAERAECDRLTIDISGDGITNDGPSPNAVFEAFGIETATVNGLVVAGIEEEDERKKAFLEEQRAEIKQYFETEVVRGPASFAVVANGFEDYKEVMTQKLLRELRPFQLSQLKTEQN